MTTASLTWFARHEIGLFWRDWTALIARGKPSRKILAGLFLAFFVIAMHLLAWEVLTESLDVTGLDPKAIYIFVSGIALVSVSMMVSQSLEAVTRAFYARADLDLILTSPAPSGRIFTVRICAVALTSVVMSALLVSPFLNVMAWREGPVWLLGYVSLLAMSSIATALALSIAVALFRTVGPKRTRSIAQIVAALIGAGFAIGMQFTAILFYGNLSRLDLLLSAEVADLLPDPDNPLWIPARALIGDSGAVLALSLFGFGLLALVIRTLSGRFAVLALSTAGIKEHAGVTTHRRSRFRTMNLNQALRRKELVLLVRDPWLLSQTLMQLLYLLVPAFLLWRNYGADLGSAIIVVPVIVMAAGQLAGGLAWLTICGEDAPDLIDTAPMPARASLRAKIEAVLFAVFLGLSPILLGLALVDAEAALVSIAGVLCSAGAATAMQVWFRAQAKRSHFRHRHASSRIATFAEAFSSISWAGAAALIAAGKWFAFLPVLTALGVLLFIWIIRPRGENRG